MHNSRRNGQAKTCIGDPNLPFAPFHLILTIVNNQTSTGKNNSTTEEEVLCASQQETNKRTGVRVSPCIYAGTFPEPFKVLLHTAFPLPSQYTQKVYSTGVISLTSEKKNIDT